MIGWASGGPFQFEVASADFAIGFVGLLCVYYRRGFWLATALISSIYLLFDSIGYIKYIKMDSPSFGTWGFFLFFEDFFIPLLLLTLALLYGRQLARERYTFFVYSLLKSIRLDFFLKSKLNYLR